MEGLKRDEIETTTVGAAKDLLQLEWLAPPTRMGRTWLERSLREISV